MYLVFQIAVEPHSVFKTCFIELHALKIGCFMKKRISLFSVLSNTMALEIMLVDLLFMRWKNDDSAREFVMSLPKWF